VCVCEAFRYHTCFQRLSQPRIIFVRGTVQDTI